MDSRYFKNFLKLAFLVIVLALIEYVILIPQMTAIQLTLRDRLLKLGEALLSACPPAVFIFWQFALIESLRRLSNNKIKALNSDAILAAAEVTVINIFQSQYSIFFHQVY